MRDREDARSESAHRRTVRFRRGTGSRDRGLRSAPRARVRCAESTAGAGSRARGNPAPAPGLDLRPSRRIAAAPLGRQRSIARASRHCPAWIGPRRASVSAPRPDVPYTSAPQPPGSMAARGGPLGERARGVARRLLRARYSKSQQSRWRSWTISRVSQHSLRTFT